MSRHPAVRALEALLEGEEIQLHTRLNLRLSNHKLLKPTLVVVGKEQMPGGYRDTEMDFPMGLDNFIRQCNRWYNA